MPYFLNNQLKYLQCYKMYAFVNRWPLSCLIYIQNLFRWIDQEKFHIFRPAPTSFQFSGCEAKASDISDPLVKASLR